MFKSDFYNPKYERREGRASILVQKDEAFNYNDFLPYLSVYKILKIIVDFDVCALENILP